MDPLNKDTDSLAAELRQGRKTDKTTLLQQLRNAGSSWNWLAGAYPRLAIGSPQELSEDEILSEPTIIYEHAERRLTLCARCPDIGGACRDDRTAISIGEKPTWAPDRKLRMEACPKYAEFRIRRRLEVSGVPEIYRDSTFGNFTRSIEPAELDKLARFGSSDHRWLIVTGPRGSGKSRIGVAVMRALFRRVPSVLLCYLDLTTVRDVLRQRYDTEDSAPDPFEHARIAHALIVDNVDPERHAREPWVNERMEAVLRQRWLDRRATLLLTHETLESITSMYSTISGLDQVTVCNLS